MYQAGLVLEGGGMKGIYTAGVLDFFLDKEMEFSSCYGVSAGACHLCNFLSKQKKRGYRIGINYLDNKRYCSPYNFFTTGDLFGTDMCYDLIPNYLDPYDYDTFNKYEGKAYAVVTNIRTGEAEYLQLQDMHRDIQAVRASSSMPLVSRNVKIGNELYLDGGAADSIPIKKSISDGNEKNVVILTKETGYHRKPSSSLSLIKARYVRHPKVYELMKERHKEYNDTLRYLEEQEKEGKAFVIRPKRISEVGRVEKDAEKLKALYEEGYKDAQESYAELLEYLS
ncbi:putative patatin/cPLA2 family phospholipase [Kineothrix alysoides]|uniref:Putative patatin/cPLA2 family phospholipase n=1 Tax=Kineothrix alysoides TaxID=1469948 RepID=A0A4V2QCA8_9FIRM|nr:patatin family protein [Kineothrix alysoides]TCL59527.1 putative patatin/cPLA2 family phospholipase [Kineothrix alysoides]